MTRKLRWKITALIMAFVSLVVVLGFAALYAAAYRSVTAAGLQALDTALHRGVDEAEMPCFLAEIMPSGTVRLTVGDGCAVPEEEELIALVAEALRAEADRGILQDSQLRYARERGLLTTRIAFVDIGAERAALRHISAIAVAVGLVALAALAGFSYLCSALVTRPVERAWQSQRQFLSDAGHELKTPLTVILSSAALLGQSAAENQRPYVDNIAAESRRMKYLLEDMLTLTGTAEDGAETAMLSLSELVTDSALRFEPVLYETGRLLDYRIEPQLSTQGNARQLRQLLDILLDNAAKYAAPRSTVTLTLRRQGRQGVICVENSGQTIPPEKLARLFERFYRGDESRGEVGGFGLGLSIAQQIAQQHGGTITAASAEGVTRFTVTLSAKRAE